MVIGILAIFSAVILSFISAWFSISGIQTVFSGAVVAATLMGASLEISKITATLWLRSWWNKSIGPLKTYFVISVIILILISSIGIYAFLADAFTGQRAETAEIENRISRLEQRIETEQSRIQSSERALDQLDDAIDEYIERGVVTSGLQAREDQREERESLRSDIRESEESIDEYRDELQEIQNERDSIRADVGPVEYIAVLLYGSDIAEENFDNAVRIFIILLVIVFDPFAVLLMVAGNKAIDETIQERKRQEEEQRKKEKRKQYRQNYQKKKQQKPKPPPAPPKKEGKKVTIDMSQFVDPEEISETKSKTEHDRKRKSGPLGQTEAKKHGPIND